MNAPSFVSALSVASDSRSAVDEVMEQLRDQLGGQIPDLVVAFATHHHGPLLEELGPRLARATGAEAILGCTAESVIGASREIEGRAAISAWAATLPETEVRLFEVEASAGPTGKPVFEGAPEVEDAARSSVVLLADPYSFPIDPFLTLLNEQHPGMPAIGGMASGAMGAGQSLFFTRDGVRDSGAIGVVLEGEIELRPVVSQGCRPIGKPWVITACEENRIRELGGRPALEVLMETWRELETSDQELLQNAPFMGLAIDPTRSTFERGDFLVRGIVGLLDKERAIAVADFVRRGQTVQLLVRDPSSASEDLVQLIDERGGGAVVTGERSAGALIFSCNGRGSRMFSEPDHDVSRVLSGLAADVPIAGFFAAGEIGPVGGKNFLHGFTASVAVFRQRSSESR